MSFGRDGDRRGRVIRRRYSIPSWERTGVPCSSKDQLCRSVRLHLHHPRPGRSKDERRQNL